MNKLKKDILLLIKKYFSVTKFFKDPSGAIVAVIDQIPCEALLDKLADSIVSHVERSSYGRGLTATIDYDDKVISNNLAVGYLNIQFTPDYTVDTKISGIWIQLSACYSLIYKDNDNGSIHIIIVH